MKQTGISFSSGSKLSSESLNIMNDKINELVLAINRLQRDQININIEVLGSPDTSMTLEQAIGQVPLERRQTGVTIKFNEKNLGWSRYTWDGTEWSNQGAWKKDGLDNIIDGGAL